MRSKIALKAGIAAIVLVVLYYFSSPFVALWIIANAAHAGDRDVLAMKVDFPSVKEGMRSQFNSLIARKAATDPDLKKNPFSGIAMMFASATINQLVDSLVTPDGLSNLVKGYVRPTNSGAVKTPALWEGSFVYLDLDHFKATYVEPDKADLSFSMLLERRGIFGWKLMKLDLPLDEISQAVKKEQNTSSP